MKAEITLQAIFGIVIAILLFTTSVAIAAKVFKARPDTELQRIVEGLDQMAVRDDFAEKVMGVDAPQEGGYVFFAENTAAVIVERIRPGGTRNSRLWVIPRPASMSSLAGVCKYNTFIVEEKYDYLEEVLSAYNYTPKLTGLDDVDNDVFMVTGESACLSTRAVLPKDIKFSVKPNNHVLVQMAGGVALATNLKQNNVWKFGFGTGRQTVNENPGDTLTLKRADNGRLFPCFTDRCELSKIEVFK